MSLGIGVEVMGIDLELHRTHRTKRLRLDDRHVVGRRDRGAGHVAAGRPTHVGDTRLHPVADRPHQPLLLHLFGQREGVAAADANRFGTADHRRGIGGAVHRADADAEFRETRLHAPLVVGIGEGDGGVGDERYLPDPAQELSDTRHGISEVSLPRIGRVGYQQ